MSDTISITIKQSGQRTFEVDKDEYETAKAEGTLDHYLDAYASDVEHDTTVVEPDGTEIDPYA